MLVIFSAFLLSGVATQAPTSCPAAPQPMPPAIESAGEPPLASGLIAFAATPSRALDQAWVVRVSHRGDAATLEIVRLLRRSACNVWNVERRWQSPLSMESYRAVAEAVRPWAAPPAGFPVNQGTAGLALDGTGLELRVSTSAGWQVTRTLNHYGANGADLSAIFHALVARYVPPAELPADDWTPRRRR